MLLRGASALRVQRQRQTYLRYCQLKSRQIWTLREPELLRGELWYHRSEPQVLLLRRVAALRVQRQRRQPERRSWAWNLLFFQTYLGVGGCLHSSL